MRSKRSVIEFSGVCYCLCNVAVMAIFFFNAGCVKERNPYTYADAVKFKAVSLQDEEVVCVAGSTTGPYEYMGCTVLVDAGSSTAIMGMEGAPVVEWRKPETMNEEALCYGFRSETGNGLIVVKQRKQGKLGAVMNNKLYGSEQSKTNQTTEVKQEEISGD